MNRPYVNLQSENKAEELLAALEQTLGRFTGMDGVIGVLLDGGLSRGYGDHLSEIDVVIYLDSQRFAQYQDGLSPVAVGITKINGALYDIKLMDLAQEAGKEYDSVALWDLSYAKILYDPDGRIARFLAEKLSAPVEPASAGRLLWDAYWHYKLAGDIWIHRGDALQGHFVFNNAIGPLLGALFIANREYIPHDKWIVHMSRSLPWKPEGFDALLTGSVLTGDGSAQSLRRRQRCIHGLWQAINQKLCDAAGFDSPLNFVQMPKFRLLTRLLTKNEYTLAQWSSLCGLDELNCEPIHSIFVRKGDKIVLEEERFLSLTPSDLYIWMYQMVEAARLNRRE